MDKVDELKAAMKREEIAILLLERVAIASGLGEGGTDESRGANLLLAAEEYVQARYVQARRVRISAEESLREEQTP